MAYLKHFEEIFLKKNYIEISFIIIGVTFPALTLIGDFRNVELESWYTLIVDGGRIITFAGIYAWFIALSIFIIITLYWIRQIILWIIVLFLLSKHNYKMKAFHPDGSCGIGFLKETISGFSVLIFA